MPAPSARELYRWNEISSARRESSEFFSGTIVLNKGAEIAI
jgi:hypothetical protein